MRLLLVFVMILLSKVVFAGELIDPRFNPKLYGAVAEVLSDENEHKLRQFSTQNGIAKEFPLRNSDHTPINYSIAITSVISSTPIKYEIYFFKPGTTKPFAIQELGVDERGYYLGNIYDIPENYLPEKNVLAKLSEFAKPLSQLENLNCDRVIGKIFNKTLK